MVHTRRADMNSILLLLCFEFHRFKIILRKILNVEIREDTHSTHDTGQKIFEAAIRYFWKRCIQRKISCRARRAFHWSWLQCNWKPAFHAFLHNCLWRGGVGWQISSQNTFPSLSSHFFSDFAHNLMHSNCFQIIKVRVERNERIVRISSLKQSLITPQKRLNRTSMQCNHSCHQPEREGERGWRLKLKIEMRKTGIM